VEKGSRADHAGFRAGDLIVRVNEQAVHDTSDFSHAIRYSNAGSVTVGIIRDKHEQNLTLALPERKDSGGLFEESWDLPDFDAEAHVDLTQLQNQMAELKPQLQFAIEESRRTVERITPEIEKAMQAAREEVERQRPEFERAMREAHSAISQAGEEFCKNQREWREQTRKLQKDLQKQRREMMRENRKRFERLQHELHGDWMQI
jgi:DNA repair exonuclease SbcCD ATPase subunit